MFEDKQMYSTDTMMCDKCWQTPDMLNIVDSCREASVDMIRTMLNFIPRSDWDVGI